MLASEPKNSSEPCHTKSDIELAEKWLSKRERELAQWPQRRWLTVVIFLVVGLLGYRGVNDGMNTIKEEIITDSFVNKTMTDVPPPGLEQRWTVGTMLKLAKVLELRQQEVAYAVLQVALGYVQILMGASMICIVILRSKRRERDVLICKLLRAKLDEL